MSNFHHFEYLIVLVISIFMPLIFGIFHPNSPFKNNLKNVFLAIFLVSIPWILWDSLATYRGHWAFSETYTLGLKIFNLPIEEIAFFWIIPYCCLFIWGLIRDFESLPKFWQKMLGKKL